MDASVWVASVLAGLGLTLVGKAIVSASSQGEKGLLEAASGSMAGSLEAGKVLSGPVAGALSLIWRRNPFPGKWSAVDDGVLWEMPRFGRGKLTTGNADYEMVVQVASIRHGIAQGVLVVERGHEVGVFSVEPDSKTPVRPVVYLTLTGLATREIRCQPRS